MFYCPKCGYEFKKPQKIYESHGVSSPPFEEILCCPDCKSTAFYEKSTTHCRCCGAKLSEKETEYCSAACKKRGELLWERQRKRRRLQSETALYSFVKEIAEYNSINNTDYSYGQYVALVENKRRKQKCKKKKKSNI